LHNARRTKEEIMSWRLMCVAALLGVTLGCDRHNHIPTAASGLSLGPSSVTVVIVTGGAFLTTGFPLNTVTVPRGSTITFVNNDTTPHMLPIAGTVRPAFLDPGARASVTLVDVGTFTFCCSGANTTVTIIVV